MFVRDWYRWTGLYSLLFIFLIVMTLISSEGDLGGYFKDRVELYLFLVLIIFWIVLIIFISIFFRDPDRVPTDGIVAPADGVVKDIREDIIDGRSFQRIVTFMNVHDVHVNRVPMDGVIVKIVRRRGKYLPAYKSESIHNHQVETFLETAVGPVRIVQIAGVFARRIVVYLSEGSNVNKGDRLGLIKFGSRVDLLLPSKKVKVVVNIGDKARANETKMAEIK